jgi:proline dehydrogenase
MGITLSTDDLIDGPDGASREALIRDKLSTRDWQAHFGQSQSLFVNTATWGRPGIGALLNGMQLTIFWIQLL